MLAHYSYGILMGGAFTPVHCTACGYKAKTEVKWRADLNAWETADDDARAALSAAHCEIGVPRDKLRFNHHWYQMLFTPPLIHLDMIRASVDLLHLVYLNLFKHLFQATVHNGLPGVACLGSRQ